MNAALLKVINNPAANIENKIYTDTELKVVGDKLKTAQMKIAVNDVTIKELENSLKYSQQELQNSKVIIQDIKAKLANDKNKNLINKIDTSINRCPPSALYSPTYPVNVMEIEHQGYGSIINNTAPLY